MRTVFVGTSEFAVGVLHRLASSVHRPTLVVTRPDRPRGRGRRLSAPPVADAAREIGIELYQPASINDDAARERLSSHRPDAVCVCAYGELLKEPLLSDYRLLNVHPSLLPRWRGAAPIERAIMAGDEQTGVSVMRVTAGLDSGPVCLRGVEPIGPDDDYGSVAARLQALGGELFVRTLDEAPVCVEQDDSHATYAEKISARDRVLDPSRRAVELERAVRALTPHIGAHVELEDGTWLGVGRARVLAAGGPPPRAVSFDGRHPVLGCAEGALELLVVQPPGRRPMSGEDYLRGHRG